MASVIVGGEGSSATRTIGLVAVLDILKWLVPIVLIIAAVFILYEKFWVGKGAGSPCSANNGTIWPFSGCNASAGLCCDGKCSVGPCAGTAQGGACGLDSDCAGWTIDGDVACCKGKCMTKKWTGQVCGAKVKGDACKDDFEHGMGTWPLDGCDISAPQCCGGKCSSSYSKECLDDEGAPCDTPDGTVWPFSGCAIGAGMCCKGKCSANTDARCKK